MNDNSENILESEDENNSESEPLIGSPSFVAGGGGGGGGSSDSSSPAAQNNQEAPLDSNQTVYDGNDCGVSSQFDMDASLNLTTDLNNAQRIILECMGSSVQACINARMLLVSSDSNPNFYYEVLAKESSGCKIQGVKSDLSNVECSFDSEATDYIFNVSDTDYPGLPFSRAYNLLKVIWNPSTSVLSGTNISVSCS